jgi:hypothetical protein
VTTEDDRKPLVDFTKVPRMRTTSELLAEAEKHRADNQTEEMRRLFPHAPGPTGGLQTSPQASDTHMRGDSSFTTLSRLHIPDTAKFREDEAVGG